MVMHVDDDKHIYIRHRLNSDVIIYIFVWPNKPCDNRTIYIYIIIINYEKEKKS